jgi:hypothetical protein
MPRLAWETNNVTMQSARGLAVVLRVEDGSSCECTLLHGLRGVSAVGRVHSCRYCYAISSRLDHSHAHRCGWRSYYLEHRSSRSLCFNAALIRLAAHAPGASSSAYFYDLLPRRISFCSGRVVQTISPSRLRSKMRYRRRSRSGNRNTVVALRVSGLMGMATSIFYKNMQGPLRRRRRASFGVPTPRQLSSPNARRRAKQTHIKQITSRPNKYVASWQEIR